MNNWLISRFVLTGFILIACKLPTETDPGELIVGEWIWIESTGGYFGRIYTPETVGYSREIIFKEDGTFLEYQEDSLVVQSQYSIRDDSSGTGGKGRVYLVFKHLTIRHSIEFEGAHIVHLNVNCIDCLRQTYSRRNFYN